MGQVLEVTSVANPRVKSIVALSLKKERVASGLFVVEGLQLVGFGVENGWELDTLVVRNGGENSRVLDTAKRAAKTILEVNVAVLAKLCRKENPQGVVGVFRQQLSPLPASVEGVWVVMEQVRDPGNLGTIIRTVDAVGADGVILVGDCTDVWSPECVRATMGSVFHVPVVKVGLDEFLAWRTGFDGRVVGTHLKGKVDYRKVGDTRPLLLCMGTEQSGLSAEMADACDDLVKIAMGGRAESLNLAMATGVLLYEVQRSILSA